MKRLGWKKDETLMNNGPRLKLLVPIKIHIGYSFFQCNTLPTRYF